MIKKSKYILLVVLVNIIFWTVYLACALSFRYIGLINNSYQSLLSIFLIDFVSLYLLIYYFSNKIEFNNKGFFKLFYTYLIVLLLNFGLNFIVQNFIFNDFTGNLLDCFKRQSYSLNLSFIFLTLGLGMRVLRLYREKNESLSVAQNLKISNELDVLKNQINPHLLFNILNNIYIQIRLDPNKASDMLLKFSDILRYQLYESIEGQVFLKAEVDFLNNYVELQKLRITNIDVKFEQNGSFSGLMIYSFMFFPFVEYAFENVGNYNENKKFIYINVEIVEKYIIFAVKNSKTEISLKQGLEKSERFIKTQQRLKFYYENNYELKIEDRDNYFFVELKLNIK